MRADKESDLLAMKDLSRADDKAIVDLFAAFGRRYDITIEAILLAAEICEVEPEVLGRGVEALMRWNRNRERWLQTLGRLGFESK